MKEILQKTSADGSKRVSVYYATDTDNPRDWCTYSHMVCEHSRYQLGDDEFQGCISTLQDLCDKYDIDWERDGDEMNFSEMFKAVSEYVVIRPISIYDHSGVTIFYETPCCRWDSGCVGYGYMERSDVEQYQTIAEDEDWREIAISIMDREMEVYDKFFRGEVYGYVLEERESPSKALTETPEWEEFLEDYWNKKFQWVETDSCWGYYEEPEELADCVLTGEIY